MKTTIINLIALVFICGILRAATYVPTTLQEKIFGADCICVGRVTSLKAYQSEEDGHIYTQAIIEVIDEVKILGASPEAFDIDFMN